MKKVTAKRIREFLKTLEENRYKKVYMADARRIAWFVNNDLSEDYDTMPESMRKKWVKAEYKKERYMAKKFLESLKQNESVSLNEGKKVTGAEFGKKLINWCDDYMDNRKLDSFEKKLISNFMDLAKGVIKGNSKNIKADQSHWENLLNTYASDAGLRTPQFIFHQLWENKLENNIRCLIREILSESFKDNPMIQSIKDIPQEKQLNLKKWYKLGFTKKEILDMFKKKQKKGELNLESILKSLNEAPRVKLIIPLRDKKRVSAIIKSMKFKKGEIDWAGETRQTAILDVEKKYYNRLLDALLMQGVNVRG